MKSRKLFYALALSAGLFTAGSALKLGSSWHGESGRMQALADQARLSLDRQNSTLRDALALKEDGEHEQRDRKSAFAAALLGLKAAGVANGVKHIQMTVAGSAGQRDLAVDALFQPLQNTGGEIAAGQLTIKGQYKDYASFQRYLEALKGMSVSIRRLSVSENAFDLDIRMYAAK